MMDKKLTVRELTELDFSALNRYIDNLTVIEYRNLRKEIDREFKLNEQYRQALVQVNNSVIERTGSGE